MEENNTNSNNNAENKTKSKKHSRLKMSFIAISLAAIIGVVSYFIKTFPHNIEGSISDVTTNNEENTLFDEILDLDETIGIENTETNEIEMYQVEDAIKLLENRIDISNQIKKLDIKKDNLKELDENLKGDVLNLINDNEVSTLIELYNDEDNNKIEKARIAQQLVYVEEINNKWLESNGIPTSKSILSRVISAGAIQAYGTFKPEEYSDVVRIDLEKDSIIKKVELQDSVSGEKDSIIILPIITDEYYDAYKDLYRLCNLEDLEIEDTIKEVNKALNDAKRCINKSLVNAKTNMFTYTKN